MCSYDTEAPDGTDTERLEEQITELAAHIHAATCRWLCLVAEFDPAEGLGGVGVPELRALDLLAMLHRTRCRARARARGKAADRASPGPRPFADGRLSYSKVRAVTRVGEVECEAELLALAAHATAAQVERLVRAYRGVLARERVARDGRPDRYVSWSHDDDGSLVLRARLPAEGGAVLLAALEVGAEAGSRSASAEALPAMPTTTGELAVITSRVADAVDMASAKAPTTSAAERRADALVGWRHTRAGPQRRPGTPTR